MRKALYLLRHAYTVPYDANGDHARSLDDKGCQQVKALATWLAPQSLKIHTVLCSFAKRAQQTWEGIAPTLNVERVEISKAFYTISSDTILHYLQEAEGDSLLWIGHNPGLGELASTLGQDDQSLMLKKIEQGYPPCTWAAFSWGEEWSMLKRYQATLEHLYMP